jgi:hypothetical protein
MANTIEKVAMAEEISASETPSEQAVVKNMFTNAASATGTCLKIVGDEIELR